jgi:hypothetical protein
MTKEEKAQLLCEKIQNNNTLRFLIKGMFPAISEQLPEEQLDWYLSQIATYQQTLAFRIEDAMNFGSKIMVEFTTENIIMGITQDGKTSSVRKTLSEVIICLSTGSLYDAIAEIKAIPADKKDIKYLTNERLTIFVNKIEDYLQIPRTTVV